MILKDIMSALGIVSCPTLIEKISDEGIDFLAPLDRNLLQEIGQKYDVFGEWESVVLNCLDELNKDEVLLTWANISLEYLERVGADVEAAKILPLPKKAEKEIFVDLFPIIILTYQIPAARERYISLGYGEKDTNELLTAFGSGFKKQTERFNKPCLPLMFYHWLCIYLGARIFKIEGFNFEIFEYCLSANYIKNKKTGKLLPLMLNTNMHKDGLILGTPGYTQEEGSFVAEYQETDDAFIGYASNEEGVVKNDKKVYSKEEWELFLKKGDIVISFHIPKDANFSPEHLDHAFKVGAESLKRYYSQYDIKALMCSSWLVSPQLKYLLKPTSNIVAFAKRFTPFPDVTSGKDVFNFVFPANVESYEDLPENTSLERALKKVYLDGGYIYTYPGIFEI